MRASMIGMRLCSAPARSRLALALALAWLGAGSAGCAPQYTPFEIDATLGKALGSAQTYLSRNEPLEAAQMARAVERIDAEYYGLADVLRKLPEGQGESFSPSSLGINRARRYENPPSPARRLLFYIPDRLADALDCFTIEAHGGAGLFGELHATQKLRGALGARVVGGLGLYFGGLGTRVQGDAALHTLGAGPLRSAGITAGTGGVRSINQDLSGPAQATDPIYQSYRDFWSIGASGTLGLGGLSAELHLIQVADWLGGFVGIDLAQDDRASTRPTALQQADLDLLQELALIGQSPDALAEYQRRRSELRVPDALRRRQR